MKSRSEFGTIKLRVRQALTKLRSRNKICNLELLIGGGDTCSAREKFNYTRKVMSQSSDSNYIVVL